MNAHVTRRALLGATAAVGAVGLPSAAFALTSPADLDTELMDLLDLWHEARAAWDATIAPYDAAKARADAACPFLPEVLQWRASDFPRTSYGRAASDAVGDTGRREYGSRGVAWLRRLRTTAQWDEAAEARRQEIVEAHEAWTQARRAVEDSTGYTAAVEACEAAADTFNLAEDDLKRHQPRTLDGLARKAAWVAGRLSDADPDSTDDDLGEVFARQVAVFGGVAPSEPETKQPVVFDVDAYLCDLRAAKCKVALSIPGTRFAGDEQATYFIAPSRGYTAVMAKWSDAIAACPDHIDQVTTRLATMRGLEL